MSIRTSFLVLSINVLLLINLSAQTTQDNYSTNSKNENSGNYTSEVRFDPLLLAFQDLDLAVEFRVGDNLSMEIMLSYITKKMAPFDPFSNPTTFNTAGIGMEFYARYYLISDHNYNRLFISPYFRYRNISGSTSNNFLSLENKRFALGVCGGYKHMLSERVSLELMLGVGYAIFNSFDYLGTLNRDLDFRFTNVDVIIRLPLAYRF